MVAAQAAEQRAVAWAELRSPAVITSLWRGVVSPAHLVGPVFSRGFRWRSKQVCDFVCKPTFDRTHPDFIFSSNKFPSPILAVLTLREIARSDRF